MVVYQETNKKKWTKDGRSWYFKCYKKDFEGINRSYKSKKYLKKRDAEEAERLFLLKRNNPIHKQFYLIVEDYFENLKKIKKESTIYTYEKDYRNHIKPYFDKLDILDINTQAIKEWHLKLEKKGLSVNYMNKVHTVLKNIFDFAIKYHGLEINPATLFGRFQKKNDEIIKDEEKIRYITLDEFNKFISVIDNIVYFTFFNFAFYTGCRKGEIFALNWHDIDFENNIISINKTLNEAIKGKYIITSTKTNKNRKIKMNKTLLNILISYKSKMEQYNDFNENWFVFGNSIHMSATSVDRYKHHYFQLCEIHEITMHEFRHSHVSLLINEYVKSCREKDMKIDTAKFFLMLSNRMGHSIEVMQKTYMHLFPTIQDEIVDLLDNL